VSFKYDPAGRRIQKSFTTGANPPTTTTTNYIYDGDNLIEETNAAGTAVARYEQTQNIDEPLAMLRSGATSYYHADGLGSITSLSNAAGSVIQTYTFDSFGKQTASSGSLVNPFQYTARESDTETGLYYYRARYYDPSTGRFLSEDPIGFKGGMDFYSYVHNTVPNVADSFGLRKNKCSWSGGCSDMPLPWLRKPCGSSPCKNKAVAEQIHKECNAYSDCVMQELGKNIAEGLAGDPSGALGHVKPSDPNPTHDGSDPIVVPSPEVGLGDLLKTGQAAFLKALQDCFKQHPLAGLDPGFNAVDVGQESTGPTWFENVINVLVKVLPQPH
jgi:RHS repeat-associated protein